MNALFYKRGKLHFESQEKKTYHRIANVENTDGFEKKTKVISAIVFIALFSLPWWILPLVDNFVHYTTRFGNNLIAALGG